MTGVQIVGIAVMGLVVIFLVAEYFMANFMATYILTPPSKLCPTPEQIGHRISQTGRVTLKIVYKKKRKFIFREHRLTVWRDHDRMHTHQPDSIFYRRNKVSGMGVIF